LRSDGSELLVDLCREKSRKCFVLEGVRHGRSPDIVMSAILSSEGKWARCGRGLKRAQDRYGFTTFHATDFKNQRGEFVGWSANKCIDF
jgi:hypothetical protein